VFSLINHHLLQSERPRESEQESAKDQREREVAYPVHRRTSQTHSHLLRSRWGRMRDSIG